MPDRTKNPALSEQVDDFSASQLPPRFAEALSELQAAINRCEQMGIPGNTVISAMMAEAMPRLVEVYGHTGAALALDQLACELSATGRPPNALQ